MFFLGKLHIKFIFGGHILKILLSLFFCIIALVGCANNNIDNNKANYNATPLSREEEVSNNITNDSNSLVEAPSNNTRSNNT